MNSSGLPDFDDLVNREEKNDFLKIIEDEYCYAKLWLYIGLIHLTYCKIVWV